MKRPNLEKEKAAADGRGSGLADLHGDVADQPSGAGADGHLLRGRSFGKILQEFLDHALTVTFNVCKFKDPPIKSFYFAGKTFFMTPHRGVTSSRWQNWSRIKSYTFFDLAKTFPTTQNNLAQSKLIFLDVDYHSGPVSPLVMAPHYIDTAQHLRPSDEPYRKNWQQNEKAAPLKNVNIYFLTLSAS